MDKIEAIVNSYNGGLDRDTSFNKFESNRYFYLENMRLISDNESASGALVNFKSPAARLKASLRPDNDDTIIGVIPVREFLVIFLSLI